MLDAFGWERSVVRSLSARTKFMTVIKICQNKTAEPYLKRVGGSDDVPLVIKYSVELHLSVIKTRQNN